METIVTSAAATPTLTTLADEIRSEHEQVGIAMRSALVHAMRVGELLIEAKAQIGHGCWLPWLEEHCDLAERTAQAYMRLYRDRDRLDPQRVADLSVREALGLLAEPKPVPEVRGRYQTMPPMTPEEFQVLKDSIAAHGVLVPVVVDENGAIIDGHERVRACAELGVTDYPRLIKAGMTEEEKLSYSYSVNMYRAHYSPDQVAAITVDVTLDTDDETPADAEPPAAAVAGVVDVVAYTRSCLGDEDPQMVMFEHQHPFRWRLTRVGLCLPEDISFTELRLIGRALGEWERTFHEMDPLKWWLGDWYNRLADGPPRWARLIDPMLGGSAEASFAYLCALPASDRDLVLAQHARWQAIEQEYPGGFDAYWLAIEHHVATLREKYAAWIPDAESSVAVDSTA